MNKLIAIQKSQALQAPVDEDQLIAEWRAWLKLQVDAVEIASTTAETYGRGMERLVKWLVATKTDIVTDDTMLEFKRDMLKEFSASSVNTWLAGIRSFYGWAVGKGRMPHDPTATLRGGKRGNVNKSHKRDSLTDVEAKALLELDLSPRDKAIIHLKLYCGLRDVEIHRANFEHLATKQGRRILFIQGKGQQEADEFIVVAKAETALLRWIRKRGNKSGPLFQSDSKRSKGKRLSLRSIRGLTKDAFKAVGISEPSKTSHSTRHTAISKAIKQGGAMKGQTLGRHKSFETTKKYWHDQERVSDAPEDLIDYGEN